MKLPFKRKKQDSDLPKEVQDYYQAEKRERVGVAGLLAVATLVVTVLLAMGLFFGGRWAYRTVFDKEDSPEVAQQDNADNQDVDSGDSDDDQADTPEAPSTPSTPAPTTPTTPSTPAPTTPATPRPTTPSTNTNLPNTGPASTMAIVASAAIISAAGFYAVRRPEEK